MSSSGTEKKEVNKELLDAIRERILKEDEEVAALIISMVTRGLI